MTFISKTDYVLWRACPKNAWLRIHKPEIYYATKLTEYEQSVIERLSRWPVVWARERWRGSHARIRFRRKNHQRRSAEVDLIEASRSVGCHDTATSGVEIPVSRFAISENFMEAQRARRGIPYFSSSVANSLRVSSSSARTSSHSS